MSWAAELILSGNEADKLAPRAAVAILGNIPNHADAATCACFLLELGVILCFDPSVAESL